MTTRLPPDIWHTVARVADGTAAAHELRELRELREDPVLGYLPDALLGFWGVGKPASPRFLEVIEVMEAQRVTMAADVDRLVRYAEWPTPAEGYVIQAINEAIRMEHV